MKKLVDLQDIEAPDVPTWRWKLADAGKYHLVVTAADNRKGSRLRYGDYNTDGEHLPESLLSH